jgi:hypothetical protein
VPAEFQGLVKKDSGDITEAEKRMQQQQTSELNLPQLEPQEQLVDTAPTLPTDTSTPSAVPESTQLDPLTKLNPPQLEPQEQLVDTAATLPADTSTPSVVSESSHLDPQKQFDLARVRRLESKLMRMLHNDRETAKRLIELVKIRYPDKDKIWCLDKVIYDLARDRRI